ncbi:helix-turn-helix transcriptional regulator [Sphingomonas sp. C3-2]|uniref:helix-turn-helix transcriptional regulator n=1 Tax=Sphingomonas sp. C3-2 TaxID=3062169 RepID=UPI00294B2B4F|nr:helix-turn-helix transcriptional regulator [Sphingomonas sp. C3-2]WOK36109.1 helix-turn-helix transcriptional regulator [Sphingomonas sp. C3-2]
MHSLNEVDAVSGPLLKLYSSLTRSDPWTGFLEAMRQHFDASFVTIILTPPTAQKPGLIITPNVDRAAIAAAENYFACDPFVGLPEGKAVSTMGHIGRAAYRKSRFYREYVAHYQIGDILGLDLMARSGFQMRVRVCRLESQPDFSREEQDWLMRFVPHLRAAIDLYERFKAQHGEADVYDSAIEQLSIGTILLDRTGNIIRCNDIARSVLAESDAIKLVGNRLAFSSLATDRAFKRGMTEQRDMGGPSLRFLRVENPSGQRDIGLALRALTPPSATGVNMVPATAVFLTDPNRQADLTGKVISGIFGLTPMEGEIAACLSNGLRLSQTAEVLGIAQNTVRAHLRSIFTKLGVSRQSQLVQRIRVGVHGLVAGASAPAAGARALSL